MSRFLLVVASRLGKNRAKTPRRLSKCWVGHFVPRKEKKDLIVLLVKISPSAKKLGWYNSSINYLIEKNSFKRLQITEEKKYYVKDFAFGEEVG